MKNRSKPLSVREKRENISPKITSSSTHHKQQASKNTYNQNAAQILNKESPSATRRGLTAIRQSMPSKNTVTAHDLKRELVTAALSEDDNEVGDYVQGSVPLPRIIELKRNLFKRSYSQDNIIVHKGQAPVVRGLSDERKRLLLQRAQSEEHRPLQPKVREEKPSLSVTAQCDRQSGLRENDSRTKGLKELKEAVPVDRKRLLLQRAQSEEQCRSPPVQSKIRNVRSLSPLVTSKFDKSSDKLKGDKTSTISPLAQSVGVLRSDLGQSSARQTVQTAMGQCDEQKPIFHPKASGNTEEEQLLFTKMPIVKTSPDSVQMGGQRNMRSPQIVESSSPLSRSDGRLVSTDESGRQAIDVDQERKPDDRSLGPQQESNETYRRKEFKHTPTLQETKSVTSSKIVSDNDKSTSKAIDDGEKELTLESSHSEVSQWHLISQEEDAAQPRSVDDENWSDLLFIDDDDNYDVHDEEAEEEEDDFFKGLKKSSIDKVDDSINDYGVDKDGSLKGCQVDSLAVGSQSFSILPEQGDNSSSKTFEDSILLALELKENLDFQSQGHRSNSPALPADYLKADDIVDDFKEEEEERSNEATSKFMTRTREIIPVSESSFNDSDEESMLYLTDSSETLHSLEESEDRHSSDKFTMRESSDSIGEDKSESGSPPSTHAGSPPSTHETEQHPQSSAMLSHHIGMPFSTSSPLSSVRSLSCPIKPDCLSLDLDDID